MKVLIACEFSGIIRDAFKDKGHNAWSCDLLPTESPGNHIQDNVLKYLNKDWDLIIAHPPCTYLTVSANRWYKDQLPRKSGVLVGEERRKAQIEAIAFFMEFVNVKCNKVVIENPIGIMSTTYRKPDQIIQPWMFGHGETKATCLWIKNLPLLKPSNIVVGREAKVYNMPFSKDRGKLRSVTYQGIAIAMAEQWN